MNEPLCRYSIYQFTTRSAFPSVRGCGPTCGNAKATTFVPIFVPTTPGSMMARKGNPNHARNSRDLPTSIFLAAQLAEERSDKSLVGADDSHDRHALILILLDSNLKIVCFLRSCCSPVSPFVGIFRSSWSRMSSD